MRHIALLAALAASVPGLSHAQASGDPAPPRGLSLQTLNPAPPGDRFVGVPDGRVRGMFEVYGRALFSYAHRPLANAGEQQDFIENQLYGHFDVSLALGKTLLFRGEIPVALLQRGEAGFAEEARSGEMGDSRLTLRVNWLEALEGAVAIGTQVDVTIASGNAGALTGDRLPRANPMLNVSGYGEHFAYAASAGYVFRAGRSDAGGQVGAALTFGAGAGLLLLDGALQVGPEIHGQSVTESSLFTSRSTPLELLMTSKLRTDDIVLGVSVGPGLSSAPGTPNVRLVTSIAYVPDDRVLDADGDGFSDRDDRCPTDPGFGDSGCPPPDTDGDTILDALDACPDRPGLVHADPGKNGCPPEPAASIPEPSPRP